MFKFLTHKDVAAATPTGIEKKLSIGVMVINNKTKPKPKHKKRLFFSKNNRFDIHNIRYHSYLILPKRISVLNDLTLNLTHIYCGDSARPFSF